MDLAPLPLKYKNRIYRILRVVQTFDFIELNKIKVNFGFSAEHRYLDLRFLIGFVKPFEHARKRSERTRNDDDLVADGKITPQQGEMLKEASRRSYEALQAKLAELSVKDVAVEVSE